MNKEQLQEIRNIKYKLTFALADIADICSQLGVDSQTPKSFINILDNTFRLIYSTSDSEMQFDLLRSFFKKDFPQLIEWKSLVFPTFDRNAKEIKAKTIEIIQKNTEINDEMSQKIAQLNVYDEPFGNVDIDFFNFKSFIESLPVKQPLQIPDSIFKQVSNYETFFTVLKLIKLFENFKEKNFLNKEESDKKIKANENSNAKAKNPNNQNKIEDPDRDFVNEYNALVARIEGNGSKTTMTGEERIQARIQQKLMILEHESQILRDNLFIITKQKEEMIQTYEKHIKEIEKQNKKLYEENEILKKKILKEDEKKK